MNRMIFRRFRYTECDDFAVFLSKMAQEGWHFKGWKLGLVFEQGEPEDVEYSVEIFIKGTQWDTRPDADTEEFAEYCKEAGWEFVDSNKKFVVFKKVADDAVDIVSPEEHLRNASKAELKGAVLQCIGWILIAGINLFRSITESFYHDVFSNSLLTIVLVFITYIFISLAYAIRVGIRYTSDRKKLTYGEKVYVGIGVDKQRKRCWAEIISTVLIILLIVVVAAWEIGVMIIIPVIGGTLLLMFSLWFIEYIRPVRANYVLSILAVSVIVPVIITVFIFLQPEEENVYKDKSMAPLLIEDYRKAEYEFEDIQIEEASNFLGTFTDYTVTYHEEADHPDDEKWDQLQYMLIESKYDWILDYSWKVYTKDFDEYTECTEEWDANYAIKVNYWWDSYCVRYDNQIFIMRFEPTLTQDEISVVREQMRLGQVL